MPRGSFGTVDNGTGQCETCDAFHPPREPGKRGPNPRYCDEETTGRPCGRIAREMAQIVARAEQLIELCPRSKRKAVRARLAGQLASRSAELRIAG
jgi:hypothetical protein